MTFEWLYNRLAKDLLANGRPVETHWQATRGVPQNQTLERFNVPVYYGMPQGKLRAQEEIDPVLPWAEDHFQERVSRIPHNPPPSAAYWAKTGVDDHRDDAGRFSHTYPERFWPKRAERGALSTNRRGIRYYYGDLDDVVSLLAREPYTRQAYLPVWFPEDTGAVPGERVPCTLGYHFILRDNELHCFYPIRSCDFLRHFRNDVYLAVRLTQWILDELIEKDPNVWENIVPGTLTMHIVSLHVFEADLPIMRMKYEGSTT